MAAGLSFELLACRLSFFVDGIVRFPDRASNTFRGALGFVLPEEIFRPRLECGPSGLADAPRPFVLQAKELDGLSVAGSSFGCDLNLFDPSLEPEFKQAFQTLAERGITPSRTRLRLEKWESRPVVIRLDEVAPVTRLRVTFETPTELKGWDGDGFPPFEVLACRLRDRISALISLYGQPAPGIAIGGGRVPRLTRHRLQSLRRAGQKRAGHRRRTGSRERQQDKFPHGAEPSAGRRDGLGRV